MNRYASSLAIPGGVVFYCVNGGRGLTGGVQRCTLAYGLEGFCLARWLLELKFASFQVAASAGPACASALREVTRQVDIELASNPLKIKSLFGVEQVCSLYSTLCRHFTFFALTAWISCVFLKPEQLASAPASTSYAKNAE